MSTRSHSSEVRYDYVVLITVPVIPKGVKVLAVLADRKKETVANFLASIPPRLQKTVKSICTDMYQGFVNAAQEQLPGVKIVIDRYHGRPSLSRLAAQVRKKELKVLKRELSEDDYEQVKGAMWPFRKSPSKLKDEEKQLLERLFSYSPRLKEAYILREDLTDIFERNYTKSEGKDAIQEWCQRVRQSQINEFKSFLGTIETWLDKIYNYFLERLTSGFVEGFNNRVKALKRRCYGIFRPLA